MHIPQCPSSCPQSTLDLYCALIPVILGRLLAWPHHSVCGPEGAETRQGDAGGARQPPLPLPHGVREAAAGGQRHHRRPRDQGSVRGQQPGRDLGGVPAQRQRLLHRLQRGHQLRGPLRRQVRHLTLNPLVTHAHLQTCEREQRESDLREDRLPGLPAEDRGHRVWRRSEWDISRIKWDRDSCLFVFRVSRRRVCCGRAGRDPDPPRNEISPDRHREQRAPGAQEDRGMVSRSYHGSEWLTWILSAPCSPGPTYSWWSRSSTGMKTRLLILFL